MVEKAQADRIFEILSTAESTLKAHSRERATGVRREVPSRIMFALIGLLALANLYFVNQLTQEIKTIIASMNEMYTHFERVSQRMTSMRDYVTNMEGNIRMMPIIREQMAELSEGIGAMNRDVANMTASVVGIDQRVGSVNASVGDMMLRFRSVNRSVGRMGVDVDRMAQPIP
jgi:cation transport regulator ChaC